MRSRYRCSMCPAIHNNSRSWLRSSSTHEPSDPPLRVVFFFLDEIVEFVRTANAQATDGRAARLSNIATAQRKKTRRKHERVPASQEDGAGAPGKENDRCFQTRGEPAPGGCRSRENQLRPTVGLASLNGPPHARCYLVTRAHTRETVPRIRRSFPK